MKPYFEVNHIAGLLLLMASAAWGMMELAQLSQTHEARKGATRVRFGGWRLLALTTFVAVTVGVYLAPWAIPAAAIRPGAAAFGVGLAVLLAGLVLRGWSIKTLGDYFTPSVLVSSDQPVVTAGPYRVLRHPSYTGALLACAGVGLAAANWIALAVGVVVPLVLLLWRIHVEERALMTTLGDRYRRYAASRKRLVPLVW
jgi:protein-S-isoprenylcysteine O-methyltransferase Ste14